MTKKKPAGEHKPRGRRPTRVIKLNATSERCAGVLLECEAAGSYDAEVQSQAAIAPNNLADTWQLMRITPKFMLIARTLWTHELTSDRPKDYTFFV